MKLQELINYLNQAKEKIGNVDVYLFNDDDSFDIDYAQTVTDIVMQGEQSLMNTHTSDDNSYLVIKHD